MKSYNKIAITTGDKNGIGFEVTAKALSQILPSAKQNKSIFFLYRHKSQITTQPQFFALLDKTWLRLTFNCLADALLYLNSIKNSFPDNLLLDLSLATSEALWVAEAALACKNKKLSSLVTGPLSKKITSALPRKPLGHTGIFRHLFPNKKLFMSFIGKDFTVVLATDHVPLTKVEGLLKKDGLDPVFRAAQYLKLLIKSKKKIAVLGLNPHSGEDGLIGATEKQLFTKLPKGFVGPLVPDVAFLKKNWSAYSVFVCLYHDQGLIPFKMHHGQDCGVHLTLGLPFIRTSVDHGTAFNIFNKNIANPNSMLEAIKLGIELTGA